MSQGWVRLVTAVVFVAATASNALGQASSTASISGVVTDADGGVLPGADVIVKNIKTGETFTTVSSDRGVFAVPALITGTYSVSVSLQGFKSSQIDNVILNSGVPVNVRATLELGGVTETVTVQANSDLVQTQTATVATTLDTRQIQNLPLASRDASQFIAFMPGVSSPDTTRNSSVNGMPQSAINMTLDGVNIQDNTLKSTDGFFAIVGPRIDAIEEITVITAAGGAEALGGGSTQIRYTTRSGTNQFFGSGFHQYRSDSLNTNTYFNERDKLPKPELLLNQPGFNVGGPIRLPGFDGRNRAFFFVNYEELRQPSDLPRNRQQFHPDSMNGVFRYSTTGGGVGTVNLFELAARSGQLATADPIVSKLFADIRSAMASEGSTRDLSDPLYQQVLEERADRVEESLPDRAARLPGQRPPSRHLVDEQPVLRWWSRHHQQPRSVLPGIPGAGQPVVHAARHERIAAVDARQHHGQRVPHRVRRRAGRLRGGAVQSRPVEWLGCEPGRLLPELREFHGLHPKPADPHERGARRHDVVT